MLVTQWLSLKEHKADDTWEKASKADVAKLHAKTMLAKQKAEVEKDCQPISYHGRPMHNMMS